MIYPNAKYEIYVCDNYGNIVAPFNIVDFNLFVEVMIQRSVNEIGSCYIKLSGGSNSTSVLTFMSRYNLLKKDTILQIYRIVGSKKSLLLDTVWFVRTIEQYREATGSFIIKITAYDTNYLLASRLTSGQFNNSPTTAYTNTQISTIMSSLVSSNIGSGSNTRRMASFSESVDLGNYGYLVEHYTATGISYPYVNLLSALQELSQLTQTPSQANEDLFPVFFDTVSVTSNSFIFQLFANQRGEDRRYTNGSRKGLLLSDTLGQLQRLRFEADWQDEKTSVTALYRENNVALIATNRDERRIANSPFSVRETFVTARTNDVNSATINALREPINFPKYTVYATIQDVPAFLFGVDWNYGDYVTVNAFGTQVDARIHAITITLTNKAEQIDVNMQVSESLAY
jgi:Siphovirus ReqiPepy6 Gp37-like protein